MQVDSPPALSSPIILETLPDISGVGDSFPRRARVQLDLLLLGIEALDLDGSEALLAIAKDLELQGIVKDRVNLWRMRCANPLRKYGSQRRELSHAEAKALTLMVCHLARRLTALIRQLLLAYDQLSDRQLPLESSYRLSEYLERFRAHFRSRMNPKRAAVIPYMDDDKLNSLAMNVLNQLLFCTGTAGPQRLWSSLFDGEVA
ncbi:DUF3038 domain-containing protein [Leptolyngbya sp. AN02str]|uniref:DUF3038 domain-containing protein n=1 Tax=Leptolyngbya sp. AN02str TaxID=3423363 RepID=UPI003D30FE8A